MGNCNITLFAKEHLWDNEIVVVESLVLAVIDTACSRTVCGEKWLSHYVKCTEVSIPMLRFYSHAALKSANTAVGFDPLEGLNDNNTIVLTL